MSLYDRIFCEATPTPYFNSPRVPDSPQEVSRKQTANSAKLARDRAAGRVSPGPTLRSKPGLQKRIRSRTKLPGMISSPHLRI